jgi:hypothetical protein
MTLSRVKFSCILVFTFALPLRAGEAAGTSQVKRFYADSSFWNTPISADPSIDPNSGEMVRTAILPYRQRANFTNSRVWGISLVVATPDAKLYTVACLRYGCGRAITFPIPYGTLPDTGSDHHLVVINPETSRELDLWDAHYNPSSGTWSAGSAFVEDLYGWGACGPPGDHCLGGVAAGFAEMGGVVRPEEIRQGRIEHALSITMPYTRKNYIACPATHTDGKYSDSNAIPEGACIQLDPTFDVDAQSWPTWEKIIAKALQTYGAYVSDTGGTIAIYGQSDMNAGNLSWRSVGVPDNGPSLARLPWDKIRVLTVKSCN